MSDDVMFNKKSLRFWYYRYKDSAYFSLSLISLIIFVCIILIWQVIIPQMQEWFSIRNEIVATRERIATMKNNINFLNNLDRSTLDSQLQVATLAIPQNKDFGNILNAISASALSAGVSLGDFSFQVGSISSASGQMADPTQNGMTAVDIQLLITGDIDGTKRFIKEIKEKLPLSEVVNVDGSQQSSSVTLRFYQKDFPKLSFNKSEPIQPVSEANRQLIQQLSKWQVPPQVQNVSTQGSSSSGSVPLF